MQCSSAHSVVFKGIVRVQPFPSEIVASPQIFGHAHLHSRTDRQAIRAEYNTVI